MSRIEERTTILSTPWFTFEARSVEDCDDTEPYYCLATSDYVALIALTENNAILLVRQYRPAVDRITLELPGGHRDPGEAPEISALRELREETGYETKNIIPLGVLSPDNGRIDGRMHCFFATGAIKIGEPEGGITVETFSRVQLFAATRSGEFDHALHLSLLFLATEQGLW